MKSELRLRLNIGRLRDRKKTSIIIKDTDIVGEREKERGREKERKRVRG